MPWFGHGSEMTWHRHIDGGESEIADQCGRHANGSDMTGIRRGEDMVSGRGPACEVSGTKLRHRRACRTGAARRWNGADPVSVSLCRFDEHVFGVRRERPG